MGTTPTGTAPPTQPLANLTNGTGWQDKSGNSRHADTTSGDPQFQVNQLNGLGVIDFDGNDKVYVSNDAFSLAAHTENFSAFLLVRMTNYSGGDWARVLSTDNGTGTWDQPTGTPRMLPTSNGQVSPTPAISTAGILTGTSTR